MAMSRRAMVTHTVSACIRLRAARRFAGTRRDQSRGFGKTNAYDNINGFRAALSSIEIHRATAWRIKTVVPVTYYVCVVEHNL